MDSWDYGLWKSDEEKRELERRSRQQPGCFNMLIIVIVSACVGAFMAQSAHGEPNEAVGGIGAAIGALVGLGLVRLYINSVEADRQEAAKKLRAQRGTGCLIALVPLMFTAMLAGSVLWAVILSHVEALSLPVLPQLMDEPPSATVMTRRQNT